MESASYPRPVGDFRNSKLIVSVLLVAFLVSLASWLTQLRIEAVTRTEIGKSLSTVLATTQQAVRTWLKEQESTVFSWPTDQTYPGLIECRTPPS